MTVPAASSPRFRLATGQVAAALTIAGIRPSPHSGLPDPPPARQPARLLAGSGVVTPNGALVPEFDRALRIAAAPVRVLLVNATRAGDIGWVTTSFLRGDDGPYVVQSRDGDVYDFAVVPTPEEAAVAVDHLISLSALAAVEAPSVDLDLAGFVALAAAADCVQASRLQARLARQPDPPPPFSAAHLEQQLAAGMASADTRWAVTASRLTSPVNIHAATGRLEAGAQSLASLGIVSTSATGFSFTAGGQVIADALSQLVTVGSLSAGVVAGDGRLVVGHVSVFRSATSIWLAAWRRVLANDASVHLFAPSSAGALRLVEGLLQAHEPAPVPPVTVTTEAAVTPAPATTTSAIPTQAAVPPTIPSAISAFAPTHTIPAGGLAAWPTPDATGQSVQLDAGLPVQVVERYGDFARVACSNGFVAWVDGLSPA